jgi:ABC-type Fe3+-hydroxamate transport system substrate-binding protein
VLITDDLGHSQRLPRAPARVVSLVPSLTESIAASAADLLVGATDWCTHPQTLDVTRVRGTKNPDLKAVASLRPDLVVANQEENREIDVSRLRAEGLNVWVTKIESLDEAFRSLRRLFAVALGRDVPAWIDEASEAWSVPPVEEVAAAAMIWREPWMAVGAPTFADDLMNRLGYRNVFRASGRYPYADPSTVVTAGAEVVLLPDEPYPFAATDGPEAFPSLTTKLVSGRLLTWYGPSLISAHLELALS